jgi:hypothetical protein
VLICYYLAGGSHGNEKVVLYEIENKIINEILSV